MRLLRAAEGFREGVAFQGLRPWRTRKITFTPGATRPHARKGSEGPRVLGLYTRMRGEPKTHTRPRTRLRSQHDFERKANDLTESHDYTEGV
jgi:hypothetical protein